MARFAEPNEAIIPGALTEDKTCGHIRPQSAAFLFAARPRWAGPAKKTSIGA
jgi:hypothetical protein